MSDSIRLFNTRCPQCAERMGDTSGNNLVVYTDGHAHCFACGLHAKSVEGLRGLRPEWAAKYLPATSFEAGDADRTGVGHMAEDTVRNSGTSGSGDQDFGEREGSGVQHSSRPRLLSGAPRALNTRGITEDTCQFWDYQVASLHGETVQVANYKDEYGNTIGQKIRKKDKSFVWKGSPNDCGLYGKWLWKDGGKMVVITEGEIDALSVSQAQGNKWPVVSLKNGASGALKDLQKDLEWLETFEQVILFFDQDKAGWTAVEQCVELFSPGKARVVHLPEGYKDANDLLKDGKATTIIDCIWRARTHRPDGIVKPQDILADALKPIEIGLPYPWPQLTAVTYGIRPRELIGVGAGTGVGKTDFVQEIVLNLLSEGVPVGLFFLEESPSLSLKKLAGKLVGKRFHIPGVPWAPDELRDAIMQLGQDVNFYNHEGVIAWDRCKLKMRYMAKAEGVKFFVLDNLTALVAVASDEKKELERIMAELSGLCHELDCTIMFISHLATPESGSHEEGARVSIRHFKGSRAIGFWSNFLIGLERDQQAEDTDERNTTTVRILKDRYTGNSLGYTFNLFYNRETGRLEEDLDLNPFG